MRRLARSATGPAVIAWFRDASFYSSDMRAQGLDVYRMQRLTGCHEQAVPFDAAETQVAAGFGQENLADALPLRIKDVNAIVTRPKTRLALDQMLPSTSARIPSEPPAGSPFLVLRIVEANSRPLLSFPASATSHILSTTMSGSG